MKTSFGRYSILLKLFIVTAGILFLIGHELRAQAFKLSAVSDMTQVFEDGYNMPPLGDTVHLFGIRGEIISGQCVINAKNNLTNVKAEVSLLENIEATKLLPPCTIEWNFVGSIPLSKNTPNQPMTVVVRKAPARFPDYLMTDKQLNMNKGTSQAVWLTISIRENAQAGKYSGKDMNKFEETGLTPVKSEYVNAPYIKEFPIVLECKVTEYHDLGSHRQFIGQVIDAKIDERLLNEDGEVNMDLFNPIIYGQGKYYSGLDLIQNINEIVPKVKN